MMKMPIKTLMWLPQLIVKTVEITVHTGMKFRGGEGVSGQSAPFYYIDCI